MKYLLDTCIIISALRSKKGASHFLFRKAVLKQLPIQWLYMKKLKNLSASVTQEDILALLDKAPECEPLLKDKMP